jgi:hypothetical protein
MGPPLLDDNWLRRGISLLWDAESLTSFCSAQQVISVRGFLLLHAAGWSDVDLTLINEVCLVVGGLESAIDALPPEEAILWLEKTIYPAIMSYQECVAGGSTEASLIFWIADSKRIDYHTSDDTYYWHCGTEFKGQQIPLSRCLFNGAQDGLRRIVTGEKRADQGLGLFLLRIS